MLYRHTLNGFIRRTFKRMLRKMGYNIHAMSPPHFNVGGVQYEVNPY